MSCKKYAMLWINVICRQYIVKNICTILYLLNIWRWSKSLLSYHPIYPAPLSCHASYFYIVTRIINCCPNNTVVSDESLASQISGNLTVFSSTIIQEMPEQWKELLHKSSVSLTNILKLLSRRFRLHKLLCSVDLNHSMHTDFFEAGTRCRSFADDIFKCICDDENHYILIHMSLKFVSNGSFYNKSTLLQVGVWPEHATSHCLNKWWPSLQTPTHSQWCCRGKHSKV